MSKESLKFCQLQLKHAGTTFSRQLQTCYPYVQLNSADSEGVSFSYKVKPGLCRLKNPEGIPMMSTGALMAVFDDLSTYSFMYQDPNCRPGVSIQLQAEIFRPIPANTSIIVSSKALKCGRNVGFCDMKLVDLEGQVLAVGKHIKYLPMGGIWDFVTHKSILPNFLNLYEKYGDSLVKSYIGKKIQEFVTGGKRNKGYKDVNIDLETTGSLFSSLPLQCANHNLSDKNKESKTSLFSLATQPFMNNPMGALHGGALAIACEEAVMLCTVMRNFLYT